MWAALCWHSQTHLRSSWKSILHFQTKKKRVRLSAWHWLQKETCWWILDKDLNTTFCALERYQEYAHEAESSRVGGDSPKCPVVIVCNSLHEVKLWPRDTANWTIPVIPYPQIEVSGVKVLEILIKWHKILVWKHAQGYVAGKISASIPKPFLLTRENWFISKQRTIAATHSYVTYNSKQQISYYNYFKTLHCIS